MTDVLSVAVVFLAKAVDDHDMGRQVAAIAQASIETLLAMTVAATEP